MSATKHVYEVGPRKDRRDILLTPEGSKDGLAALHFADAEDRLSTVGVVIALGAAIKLRPEDLEKCRGRRVRIVGDVDAGGISAVARIGQQLASVANEVQVFNLAGLCRDDGLPVNDLFDATRIDYDSFEANRDLWSVTDFDSKGERVQIITATCEFFPSFPSPPREYPESHGFPVYPVSNSHELEKALDECAVRNACSERNTARERCWQLARDLKAVEKRIARRLSPDELMQTFNKWYDVPSRILIQKRHVTVI